MADLTGKQWRMETNIKAAPNSQGTLFQGGNPTPREHGRWPRGFSPERRDEVAKMVGGYPRNAGERSAEGRQGIHTIARSTVPSPHLDGLYADFHSVEVSAIGDGRAGDYRTAGRTLGVMRIAPGQAGGTTPIHEIGHHVSAQVERNWHSSYSTPGQRGQEEAYAENYAETHARDRRGRRVKIDKGPEGWASKEETVEARKALREHFYARREADSPAHSNWRPTPVAPRFGPVQTELLSRMNSGRGQYHWNYTDESPPDLQRQVPGSEEADRRVERRGERFLDMRGLKRVHSESQRFNHFPSGVVR